MPPPPRLSAAASAPAGLARPSSHGPEGRLARELRVVADRIRARRLHARAAQEWVLVALGGGAALALVQVAGRGAWLVFPLLAVASLAVLWRQWRTWTRTPLDFSAAAAAVETAHPELRQLLRTAVEQRPGDDGRYTFLQERILSSAFDHALRHDWRRVLHRTMPWPQLAHTGALAVSFALLALASRPAPSAAPVPDSRPRLARGAVAVTPGDAEVERGSTVIIAAEFGGSAPSSATLVWSRPGEAEQRTPMARSLSDPIFAHTFAGLGHDVHYRIEHDGAATPPHQITVYDRPALVRADAALDYPDYTGLTDRTIEDTRRVSAVEGTRLDYEFSFNQPLERAVLRAADGTETDLEPANPERTRFRYGVTLATSQRLALHLTGARGRTSAQPADLRLEVLPNRRPELKFTAPRGDQRPSPVEEVRLEATARDDFGLLDYGVGLGFGAGEPELVSLRPGFAATPAPLATAEPAVPAASPPPPTSATLAHLVALEPRGVAPDQLVSWFAWADDYGPDGAPRRTMSDLFFAEVRPFDEIFREDAESAGQPQNQGGGGGGGESAELVELQRQISISLWKLRQRAATPGTKFDDELTTIVTSQVQARSQLAEAQAELDDPRRLAAAQEADGFMAEVSAHVGPTADALARAWTASQGAYQALLRLQPREARVAQQRGGGGGGGGGRGNQRQMDQLEFRNADDRYETASQAQAAGTTEERERLEVLARLRALAQRQQDVNERLQQLQTALAAAQDEAERERLRRELKRLEDEQRQMVASLDEVRQQVERQPAGDETTRTREQLEQTREQMQRSREALAGGEVSQALASGTRAQEGLDTARDDLRRASASRFAEQLRDARREARELSEQQQATQQAFDELARGSRGLDDSAPREALAQQLDAQRADLAALTDQLRQITEEAEGVEPRLHRQLYDLLRAQGQEPTEQNLESTAELLRRGFLTQAQELQPGVGRAVDELRRGVERAAESVLGDEAATLDYAATELEELTRELGRERTAATDPQSRAPAAGEAGDSAAPGAGERAGGASGTPREPGDPASRGAGDGTTPGETPEGTPPSPEALAGGGSGAGSPDADPASREGDGGGASEPRATAENRPRGGPADRVQTGERSARAGAGGGAGAGAGSDAGAGGRSGDETGEADEPTEVDALAQLLTELGREGGTARGGAGGGGGGPITGEGYGEWLDQLRTVESLVEDAGLRQRLAGARERAEELRRDYTRHGALPQWGLVEGGIVAPLNDVRTWLRQELARRADPTTLQPVDRDPVPDRYSENVQRYYEALGR